MTKRAALGRQRPNQTRKLLRRNKTAEELFVVALSRKQAAAGLTLFAGGLLGCLLLTWLSWRAAPPSAKSAPFVAIYAVLFALYLGGMFWMRQARLPAQRVAPIILGVGVVFRLALLPAPPLLDDDIYRYRWDGKLVAHRENPYAFPPEAQEFAYLQVGDPLFSKIGFRDIPTVYPPLSQGLFALGYGLNPDGIWGIKTLVVLCDVGAICLLLRLLQTLGRSPAWAALYAWNPLPLKEFANTAHHDAAGIALLLFALWLLARHRPLPAALFLALTTLIKPVLLLLAPALWGKLRVRDALLWGAVVVLAYLPFASVGMERLFAGTVIYTKWWEMNDSLFALLQLAFGGRPFQGETVPQARAMVLLLWGAAAVWALHDAYRERAGLPPILGQNRQGMARAFWRMAVLLAVALALTPTMDPWYLCWLVPFLCLFPWRPWLLLTATVSLSYLYYLRDQDIFWLRPLEYVPVYGWLLVLFFAHFRRQPHAPAA
jgi:hypothetical protein